MYAKFVLKLKYNSTSPRWSTIY